MNKFLFTDGLTGVQQAQSVEELESMIESSTETLGIRIWIFNSNEWISLATFRKRFISSSKKVKVQSPASTINKVKSKNGSRVHWAAKLFYGSVAVVAIFLVFNFTRINWEPGTPLNETAVRPANMPEMDIDSLITDIEFTRQQTLDRSTRTNLRLRNTWPDRLLLQVSADKETSNIGSRFSNLDISIDNTTGFEIDEAVVRLKIWKNKKVITTDTVHFNAIRFDKLSTRKLAERYKADSVSVEFQSIRAKAFNFCYSSNLKNEAGEFADRWFCKD